MAGMYLTCEVQLNSTQMKEFIKSDQKFDLFILEKLGYGCYTGLAHKVGSPPLVGFVSLGPTQYVRHTFGMPSNPSYIPEVNVGYTDHMDIWQKLYNACYALYVVLTMHTVFFENHDAIMRKYLGPGPPPVKETEFNFSLLLTSEHFSTSYPQPYPPNVIQLTGLNIQKERGPLPKDVKEFLDGAEHGVVYFSLGSNVRSSAMPPEKVRAFLAAFADIPQRVLWKWEDDSLPGQPTNVKIAKWLPQQDVLAHQNVRLFITQGGLQSANEAAYFSVPIIGMPFIGDQFYNVAKMVAAGVGRRLDLKDVTKDSVSSTIRSILTDNRYQENMKRFSAVFREHQETSLDRAVWWIEYVIRHKGAPHLRNAAVDLHWWQLLLLDVVAFIVAVTAISLFLIYKLLRCVLNVCKQPSKLKTH